jgi:hypothetical protein
MKPSGISPTLHPQFSRFLIKVLTELWKRLLPGIPHGLRGAIGQLPEAGSLESGNCWLYACDRQNPISQDRAHQE